MREGSINGFDASDVWGSSGAKKEQQYQSGAKKHGKVRPGYCGMLCFFEVANGRMLVM